MNKEIDEVQTVKATIKKFLELFRELFDADVCYLYLINKEMDNHEKKRYLMERLKDIKNAYSRSGEICPDKFKRYYGKESGTCYDEIVRYIDILKFIDAAKNEQNDKLEGWELNFDNRPAKYVVFKKFTENTEIYGEGLTAYMVRTNQQIICNTHEQVKSHPSSAFSNHKNHIAPTCEMMIGFPLTDEKERTIGVLKIEKYSKCEYNYNNKDSRIIAAQNYLPLLVQLIKSSEHSFHKNSYESLFKGMDLLENLKKMKLSDRTTESFHDKTNKDIYEATLHLFLVLKRNEFIGYEEILTRITHYVMGIGGQLGLKGEIITSFNENLKRFRKHEELLLSGLNNYRDHFIHQFHVFVSGYIIINELGIERFKHHIQDSMSWVSSQNSKDFSKEDRQSRISEADVLRIWFLTAFYHDHAYILEKLDKELSNFFESLLGYPFSVEFNWEKLLIDKSNFSMHICDLLKFFSSKKGTNTDRLLQNYLNAIISIHDHGVLGALLLIHSSEKIPNRNYKECLYAACAISLHNDTVYEGLKEGYCSNKEKSIGISFESFPIAFLLVFCDTAQSFGRLEKKEGVEASKYPVKFFGIDIVEDEKVTYKLAYTDQDNFPSATQIEGWAKKSNEVFKSLEYSFVIEYYKPNEKDLIYALSY